MRAWPSRRCRLPSIVISPAVLVCLAGHPSVVQAQSCASGTTNSCMTIGYTAVKGTPDASDFSNGVSVIGRFTLTVVKCGRPPCTITAAAGNQPNGGLRLRVGGAQPATISDCSLDLNGVNSAQSSQAPVIAVTTGASTVTVWVCRSLSWNPAVTPIGVSSPELRFRLRQS